VSPHSTWRFAVCNGDGDRALGGFGACLVAMVVVLNVARWLAGDSFDTTDLAINGFGFVAGVAMLFRSPRKLAQASQYLEIDPAAGVARLVGFLHPLSCSLAALGPWSIERSEWTTGGLKPQRGVVYRVQAPGFHAVPLFRSDSAQVCRDWCALVDGVARPEQANPADLAGARPQVVGGGIIRVAPRVDDSESGLVGMTVTVAILAPIMLAVLLAPDPWMATDGHAGALAVWIAGWFALASLGLRALARWRFAAVVALAAGAAWIAKPWLRPAVHWHAGGFEPLGWIAPAHLAYVISGVVLVGLGMGTLATGLLERRRGSAAEPD
jgi:hypothetical protein